ncbi:MBL fold metallo-hydrolase [Nocardioides bigeumensis]|uniref:MBL fold metallo-hydrolase n=1 Tax=Nocardioides bigeumensis TaxID=433657 RepID=A0ABP5K5M9_9ACTN
MRLTVVGCSGSYPGPESPASCYLVEETDADGRVWRIVLDLGNGAFGALQRHADPLAIDAVCLTHLHADHCIDLTGYYVVRRYNPAGPQPQLPVWGPSGTDDRLARAYDLPPEPGMTEEFGFRVYDGTFELGPLTIEPRRVAHPVETYSLRITAGGRTLTYSGDTGVCAALDESAADADLFLVEASFVEGEDNPPDLHLTGREAAETAARASARRVVLTHVPPWYSTDQVLADAKGAYDGPLEMAEPGATYEV